MWALAFSSTIRACLAGSRRVRPACITRITPSMRGASTTASLTARTGGVSMMTTSAKPRSACKISPMRREPRMSAGRGGSGPLASNCRPGTLVAWSGGASPALANNMLVSPVSLLTPNKLCKAGRRKSQSTRMTRCSAWAMVMARLAATSDLPSSTPALVIVISCKVWSRLANWMLVRRLRKASAAADWGALKAIRVDVGLAATGLVIIASLLVCAGHC